jgi:hypothetical protein
LKTVPYYSALGNHDRHASLFFKNLPGLHSRRWYSVEVQGVFFIILDSNSPLAKGSVQYAWLESELRKVPESAKYTIAIFHHPLYSVGYHGADEKGVKDALLPLFELYGVSAVFSGHEHNYQRFFDKGIYFIVSGGGGASLRGRAQKSEYLQAFKMAYHFCLLTPGDTALKVGVYDVDLNLIDAFQVVPFKKRAEPP